MNVTIFQNSTYGASGLIGEFIQAKGWTARRTIFPEDILCGDLDSFVDDAVVFFGSPHGVYETDIPWIARQRQLISSLIAGGTPVLGVCFGGQLLATAAGGAVAPMGKRYRAWLRNEHATDDVWQGPWLRWHGDFITLPDTVEVFARDQGTVQAFQYGSGVGLQFHPEVSAELLDGWERESDPTDEISVAAYKVARKIAVEQSSEIRNRAFTLFDHIFDRITR